MVEIFVIILAVSILVIARKQRKQYEYQLWLENELAKANGDISALKLKVDIAISKADNASFVSKVIQKEYNNHTMTAVDVNLHKHQSYVVTVSTLREGYCSIVPVHFESVKDLDHFNKEMVARFGNGHRRFYDMPMGFKLNHRKFW